MLRVLRFGGLVLGTLGLAIGGVRWDLGAGCTHHNRSKRSDGKWNAEMCWRVLK